MNATEKEFIEIVRANKDDKEAMSKILQTMLEFIDALGIDKGQKNKQ